MESSRDLNLMLPVYQGGELFFGALQSIEKSSVKFSNIYISFNGENSKDYDAFINMEQMGALKRKYTVLRTNQNLTSAQHACFALENFKKIISPRSLIMFLAHDDRIMSAQGYEKAQEEFIASLRADTVYFPSYHCCMVEDYENVTHVIESNATYSVSDFFWKTMADNVATNMSGMVVPFSAWKEAVEGANRAGTGARFEHMLCIAPGVRHVKYTNKVCVLIGERGDSDGKSLSSLDHRRAAANYVWSFFKNGHLLNSGRYVSYAIELLKKSVALCIATVAAEFRCHI